MKILVIAPHPDDEILGCGGTMAKHAEKGDIVHLCIVTKAYTPDWSESFISKRSVEIEIAAKILGVKETHLLDLPTIKLDTLPQRDVNRAISKVINKVNPQIVYIPYKGDLNMDHRIVFESALVGLRPIDSSVKRILAYEVLSETEWGKPIEPFYQNVYVDITKTLQKKLNAMKAYSSELKTPPHPRSLEVIEALARKRGSEAGVMSAEAFMLIREIIH
jgi:LmbE family N-acetylglucosaminyl deacetylase